MFITFPLKWGPSKWFCISDFFGVCFWVHAGDFAASMVSNRRTKISLPWWDHFRYPRRPGSFLNYNSQSSSAERDPSPPPNPSHTHMHHSIGVDSRSVRCAWTCAIHLSLFMAVGLCPFVSILYQFLFVSHLLATSLLIQFLRLVFMCMCDCLSALKCVFLAPVQSWWCLGCHRLTNVISASEIWGDGADSGDWW